MITPFSIPHRHLWCKCIAIFFLLPRTFLLSPSLSPGCWHGVKQQQPSPSTPSLSFSSSASFCRILPNPNSLSLSRSLSIFLFFFLSLWLLLWGSWEKEDSSRSLCIKKIGWKVHTADETYMYRTLALMAFPPYPHHRCQHVQTGTTCKISDRGSAYWGAGGRGNHFPCRYRRWFKHQSYFLIIIDVLLYAWLIAVAVIKKRADYVVSQMIYHQVRCTGLVYLFTSLPLSFSPPTLGFLPLMWVILFSCKCSMPCCKSIKRE